jgi:hypothetical protein
MINSNIISSISNWDNGCSSGNYKNNYSSKDEKKGQNLDLQISDDIVDVPYVIHDNVKIIIFT